MEIESKFLIVILIAILVIVSIYMFVNISIVTRTVDTGYGSIDPATDVVTQFANFPVLVGLIGTVLLLGFVIYASVKSTGNKA